MGIKYRRRLRRVAPGVAERRRGRHARDLGSEIRPEAVRETRDHDLGVGG